MPALAGAVAPVFCPAVNARRASRRRPVAVVAAVASHHDASSIRRRQFADELRWTVHSRHNSIAADATSVAAGAGDAPLPGSTLPPTRKALNITDDASDSYCMPADVTIDNASAEYPGKTVRGPSTANDATPRLTPSSPQVLRMEVQDFPGLLRVVAWVLDGLGIVVHKAFLTVDRDGLAKNTFVLSDARGRPVPKEHCLEQRILDFVTYCTPDNESLKAQVLEQGAVRIDNATDATASLVTVRAAKKGLFLSLASSISGLGLSIHDGQMDLLEGRFTFRVMTTGGEKLNYAESSSLMYVLGLVLRDAEPVSQPAGLAVTAVAA